MITFADTKKGADATQKMSTRKTRLHFRIYRVLVTCKSLLYLLDSLFQYTFIRLVCQLLHRQKIQKT